MESGIEYGMVNETLSPIPYFRSRLGPKTSPHGEAAKKGTLTASDKFGIALGRSNQASAGRTGFSKK